MSHLLQQLGLCIGRSLWELKNRALWGQYRKPWGIQPALPPCLAPRYYSCGGKTQKCFVPFKESDKGVGEAGGGWVSPWATALHLSGMELCLPGRAAVPSWQGGDGCLVSHTLTSKPHPADGFELPKIDLLETCHWRKYFSRKAHCIKSLKEYLFRRKLKWLC